MARVNRVLSLPTWLRDVVQLKTCKGGDGVNYGFKFRWPGRMPVEGHERPRRRRRNRLMKSVLVHQQAYTQEREGQYE